MVWSLVVIRDIKGRTDDRQWCLLSHLCFCRVMAIKPRNFISTHTIYLFPVFSVVPSPSLAIQERDTAADGTMAHN